MKRDQQMHRRHAPRPGKGQHHEGQGPTFASALLLLLVLMLTSSSSTALPARLTKQRQHHQHQHHQHHQHQAHASSSSPHALHRRQHSVSRLALSMKRQEQGGEKEEGQVTPLASPPSPPPSLPLLSALAATGALETGYLTLQKMIATTGGAEAQNLIACAGASGSGGAGSCNDVLSGPYSVIPVLNVPLTAIAFVAYSSVAFLAMSLYMSSSSSKVQLSGNQESGHLVLFLSTTMATFSSYLVWLLQFVLQTSCTYCYLSATISFAMAFLAWTDRVVPNKTRATVVAASSVAMTSLTSAFLFYATTSLSLGVPSAQASTAPVAQILQAEKEGKSLKNSPPLVTRPSTQQALELADRINKLDGKMYGAYWCSHCFNQKQALGVAAEEKLEYVECDKEGSNSQYDTCRSKRIPGYPTWELQGQYYPGEKSLDELSALVSRVERGEVAGGK